MDKQEALINVIAEQRNAALNNVAMLAAELQVANQKIAELEKSGKADADKSPAA